MQKVTLCLAALMLFASAGCGEKSEEKAVEKIMEKQSGGKADVDISKNKMTITTEEGKATMQAGEDLALPADFPKDIVVYEKASIKATLDTPQGMSVTFQTADDVSTVVKKYEKGMTDKGWNKEMAMEIGDGSTLIFKKDERMVQIMIAKEDDGTMISIVIATE